MGESLKYSSSGVPCVPCDPRKGLLSPASSLQWSATSCWLVECRMVMLVLKTRAEFSGMMFISSTSISEQVLFTLFLSSVPEPFSFPISIHLHPSPVFFSLSQNSSLSLSVRLNPPEMQSDFTLVRVLSPSLTGRICGSGLFSGHCRVLGSMFADLTISSSSSELFTSCVTLSTSATHWGVWGTAAGPGEPRSTVSGNQNRNSGNERFEEAAVCRSNFVRGLHFVKGHLLKPM